MIRHVVSFTLTAASEEERAADLAGMEQRLTAMVGVIPGLRSMVVKPDLGLIEDHWDVILISEHDDNEALEGYQAHPAHLAAGAYVRSITSSERVTIDYEM